MGPGDDLADPLLPRRDAAAGEVSWLVGDPLPVRGRGVRRFPSPSGSKTHPRHPRAGLRPHRRGKGWEDHMTVLGLGVGVPQKRASKPTVQTKSSKSADVWPLPSLVSVFPLRPISSSQSKIAKARSGRDHRVGPQPEPTPSTELRALGPTSAVGLVITAAESSWERRLLPCGPGSSLQTQCPKDLCLA